MPAKLSKAVVKETIVKWATVRARIAKQEAARQAEIDPHLFAFNETTAPIYQKYEGRIASLQTQADELESIVVEWLKQQDKDLSIETETAIAERKTQTKVGPRVIDPQKFVAAAKRHGDKLWSCVTVGIALAEKLIGKKDVDAISTKTEKTVVECTVKSK